MSDSCLVLRHAGPRPSGGVAGTRTGVKCLHAHYAYHLAGGDDPVGRWVAAKLAEAADDPGAINDSAINDGAINDSAINDQGAVVADAAGVLVAERTAPEGGLHVGIGDIEGEHEVVSHEATVASTPHERGRDRREPAATYVRDHQPP